MSEPSQLQGPSPPAFSLSGRQRELWEILRDQEAEKPLSDMYYSSLKVLEDKGNPSRYVQAAHTLRELMNNIPEILEVPVSASGDQVIDKVRELSNSWNNALDEKHSNEDKSWKNKVGPNLIKFLNKAEEFFKWLATSISPRRAEANQFLSGFDPPGRKRPRVLEDKVLKKWMDIRKYFIAVTHYGKQIIPNIFTEYLYRLEAVLLDLLRPRTYDDFEEIKRIIGLGESND